MSIPHQKRNTHFSIHKSILWTSMSWWMLTISFSTAAQSNNLKFQKVLLEVNGITYNNIFAITQDKEGYIWIGTNEGLVRYDGYESKVYEHNPKDSTSIGHNRIKTIYLDNTGVLWASTLESLSRYEPTCDCFSQYRFQPNNDNDNGNRKGKGLIRFITEDAEHNLWVAMQAGGLFRYNRAQDKFIPYLNNPTDPNSLLNEYVYIILADRQNNIWIGTGNPMTRGINEGGLIRFNPSTGESKRFVHEPNNPNSLSENIVTALLEDEAGQIWIGTTGNGLHLYNPDSVNFTRIKVDTANPTYFQPPLLKKGTQGSAPITILYQDQQGGYWIGSIGIGLNHFDPKTRKLTFYDLSGRSSGLNIPSAFYEDRLGQLWLGYLIEAGLYKMDPYARKFNFYPEWKVMGRSCESQVTPGSFWISTISDGLHLLDTNTGKKTSFLHDEQDATSIGNDVVRAVYEDKEGTVWIGLGTGGPGGGQSGDGGLDKMDRQTGTFQHYKIKLNDTIDFSNTVFVIQEDQKGFLWLEIGKEVLIRFDKEKEIYKRYKPGLDTNFSTVHYNNTNLFFGALDFDKKILYQYNIEKDSFITFLEGYQVNYILEDNKGGFWLATWEQGLVYFNPTDGTLKQYTEENGLLDDNIRGLLPGENGNYWLSTHRGLVKFDSKNEKFMSEGFPKDHFNINGIKSRDGQLFFGGNKGVYAFYPDQINGNPFPPDVLIRSLQISGEPFNLAQAAAGKINLSHQQNDFNFQYTAIHNSNPAENKYQYRLLPFDENWIDAGTQRRVQYTNLDPGDYTFQVKAANSDGVWNETPATLSFHIATPWWTRWWAYLLFFTSISSLLYWFYHFQLSKGLALEESKRLKELNLVKSRLYTNITHEFRTPLTVMLGMVDVLEAKITNLKIQGMAKPINMIRRNGNNLLRLVNELLDLAKLESGQLKLELIQADVVPYVKYLGESFHSLATEKQISLTVYSETDELVIDIDSQKLAGIIANLLSNAIKFTQVGGKIIVHLRQDDQHLLIKIKDNGIGISAGELPHIFDRFYQVDNSATRQGEGTGIGLALTKELVNLMKGTIEVNSTLGKGSEFTIRIPISRNAAIGEIAHLSLNPTVPIPTSNNTFIALKEDSALPLVLIIEDNADVVYYLQACLKDKYRTLQAIDGIEGIEVALAQLPNVIICDVMMPGKDGFEVCKTLKTDERTDHIPIILLTAKATEQDRLHGLTLGADAYLTKPFKKVELFTRLEQLVLLRQKMLTKLEQNPFYQFLQQRTENAETKFLQKVIKIVLDDIENPDLKSAWLAQKLYLSESQVYRKLKTITGKSTAVFIRTIRLQKARELIQTTNKTKAEIAFQVGFKDYVWFSQAFKEEFGYAPSETISEKNKKT